MRVFMLHKSTSQAASGVWSVLGFLPLRFQVPAKMVRSPTYSWVIDKSTRLEQAGRAEERGGRSESRRKRREKKRRYRGAEIVHS
jgi:hypothetical protein